MAHPADELLVKQAQQELPYQTGAFRDLINRYKDKVLAKAVSMLDNIDDAKDMTQEVFIKVFNNLPHFELKSSFSTWLYTITVNTCLNHIDKRKRSPQWWMTEDIDDMEISQRDDESMFMLVADSLEQQELRQQIDHTLEQLDDSVRQILTLRFIDELDYQTIADKLELGLSATKMRLKRARQDFKSTFENLSEELVR
jgi:RNA polymerase sigma-70 factor (ECF subfamily)